MTKHTDIKPTEVRFPLASMRLSELNPRQEVSEQDVSDLADSIWTAGLIQNMAGLATSDDAFEIVAGGRRLRALQLLAQRHPDLAETRPDLANPMVMLAPDVETAQAWATIENIARRDLHPAEEIRAYGKMEQAGATVSVIACAFCVTEQHVYRRLALAHLPDQVLTALATNEINLSIAACFTISDDKRHSLDVLEHVRGGRWNAYQVKQMLKPESVKESDRRAIFVGIAVYTEAGGKVSRDLFADEQLLDSPDILQSCFEERLNRAADDALANEGWKWVEPIFDSYPCSYDLNLDRYGRLYPEPGELTEEQAARYDELAELAEADVIDAEGDVELEALQDILDGDYSDAQKALAGAFVYVDGHGDLQTLAGLVRPEDKDTAVAAGVLAASGHESKGKPTSPISAKLADNLSRVVTGARQQALLQNPDLMLDLLAYQLSHALNWRSPFGLRTDDVPNRPSTKEAGYTLDDRLTKGVRDDMYYKDLARSFRAFRSKGPDHVRGELNRCLAALYQGRDEPLQALVAKETNPQIRAVWTPTAANFFSRVKADYLEGLWCNLLEIAPNHPTATTFAKLKKADKVRRLEDLFHSDDMRAAHSVTPEQAKKIDAWLPEGMEDA